MADPDSENLVAAISARVREALDEAERRGNELVEDAERRANEIIAEAEDHATRIQAKAESEASKRMADAEEKARERIDRAREALEELGVTLTAAAEPESAEPVEPEDFDDEPAFEEDEDVEDEAEEEAPEPEPETEPEPEPSPDPVVAPAGDSPSTDELIAQLRGGGSEPSAPAADSGAEAAARLVAMNMALDGASREEVDRHLADEFGLSDSDALLDEVFSRVGG